MSEAILTVNAGSTSLKLAIVESDRSATAVHELAAAHGRVAAVAHRIVHGGAHFRDPVIVDDRVERALAAVVELAPLHMVPSLEALRQARRVLADVPHVAVFDTAFHATLPAVAAEFALPRWAREELGIRRYGFHGLSVRWAAEQVRVPRLVVCHLGGGASVTAVRDGRSVDTTMGFTPLDGVPMGTRCGAVDPGALIRLLRTGRDADALEHLLARESGLLGLSGISASVRDLEAAGTAPADHALAVFAYRVATAVGAMAVAAGGIDALAFSGGVGEGSSGVRAAVADRLGHLGVALDRQKNRTPPPGGEIGRAGGSVRVLVVAAREDLVLAHDARAAIALGRRATPN